MIDYVDTIKVEMQASAVSKRAVTSGAIQLYGMNRNGRAPVQFNSSEGSLMYSIRSIYQQSPFAFYRGLGAVMMGIMPKMAIRFTSFETYKAALTKGGESTLSSGRLFVGIKPCGILNKEREIS
jgi:Mitochondrial carrier protein